MLSAKSLSKTSDVWFARGNNEKRENNSLDEAKEYLEQLKELREETGFERINQRYQLASISIMKASGKMSELVIAAEILNDGTKYTSTYNRRVY